LRKPENWKACCASGSNMRKKTATVEFGDFQTPSYLANRVCDLLVAQGLQPCAIVEPTCGKGSLLLAALERFPTVSRAIGVDINPDYIACLEKHLNRLSYSGIAEVSVGDFFAVDWERLFSQLPEPILVIGNPPWVTNAELSALESTNLPHKTNFQALSGLSAKTGKSNFDISEWMLIQILKLKVHKQITVAMLCKTSVARKVLAYAWKEDLSVKSSRLYRLDAQQVFGAAVDACLLVCHVADGSSNHLCQVYAGLSEDTYETTFGFRNGLLIADMDYFETWQHLQGEGYYRWRSGIKHDAAAVMELKPLQETYLNKFGESVDVENIYLYPMLKSSEIAHQNNPVPTRWMLVTQRHISEDTTPISSNAPKTWAYLHKHAAILDGRKSSIYRNRPRFSMFGIGEYTFAPWKIAISGLYKKLHFVVIGPYKGKPVVLDDTCSFLPCKSRAEAYLLETLLNSEVARQFYSAFIFWDAKRPITIDILNRLDVLALARELGEEKHLLEFVRQDKMTITSSAQLTIWKVES